MEYTKKLQSWKLERFPITSKKSSLGLSILIIYFLCLTDILIASLLEIDSFKVYIWNPFVLLKVLAFAYIYNTVFLR